MVSRNLSSDHLAVPADGGKMPLYLLFPGIWASEFGQWKSVQSMSKKCCCAGKCKTSCSRSKNQRESKKIEKIELYILE
jgi:hypothetical protein